MTKAKDCICASIYRWIKAGEHPNDVRTHSGSCDRTMIILHSDGKVVQPYIQIGRCPAECPCRMLRIGCGKTSAGNPFIPIESQVIGRVTIVSKNFEAGIAASRDSNIKCIRAIYSRNRWQKVVAIKNGELHIANHASYV